MGAAPATASGERGEARRPPLPRPVGAHTHVHGPEEGGRDGVGDRRAAQSQIPSPSVAAGGGSSPPPGLAQGPCNYPGKIALLWSGLYGRMEGGKIMSPPNPPLCPAPGTCAGAARRPGRNLEQAGGREGRRGGESQAKALGFRLPCPIPAGSPARPTVAVPVPASSTSQPSGTRRPCSPHPLRKGRPGKTGRKQPQKGFSPAPARAEAAEAAVQAGASPARARGELWVQT